MAGNVHALTIDVEDYFHAHALASAVEGRDLDALPHRFGDNCRRLLDILSAQNVKGTFFVLGWVAERDAELVRRIHNEGHELASHGYCHIRVDAQKPDQFRADVRTTRQLLADISGAPIWGYRAASFSLGANTPWAHDILAEEGYVYSSSIYPRRHDHYGDATASLVPYRAGRQGQIVEIPACVVDWAGRRWPASGGGYFRLLPLMASKWLWRKSAAQSGRAPMFYTHPWEIDPGQPRLEGPPLLSRFRHYVNLAHMEGKLTRVLSQLSWDRMDRVYGDVLGGLANPQAT